MNAAPSASIQQPSTGVAVDADGAAPTLNVLSLFSGIGGLELGLERAGMTVVGQVEISEFCRTILAHHWPEVPRHDDVHTTVEWWRSVPRPPVHVVAGGFPCQPVSSAGLGLAQEDPRWLWPATFIIVRELRPRWVLLENVGGLLSRGLGDVLGDLASIGYDTEWDCIPASALGARHQRDRIFIVAYPDGGGSEVASQGRRVESSDTPGHGVDGPIAYPRGIGLHDLYEARRLTDPDAQGDGDDGPVADPAGMGRGSQTGDRAGTAGVGQTGEPGARGGPGPDVADPDDRRGSQDASGRDTVREAEEPDPERRGGDVADPDGPDLRERRGRTGTEGRPESEGRTALQTRLIWTAPRADDRWASEPDVGRVVDGFSTRLDRLKLRLRALGNAVVPPVAEHLGRLIVAAEQERGWPE